MWIVQCMAKQGKQGGEGDDVPDLRTDHDDCRDTVFAFCGGV